MSGGAVSGLVLLICLKQRLAHDRQTDAHHLAIEVGIEHTIGGGTFGAAAMVVSR